MAEAVHGASRRDLLKGSAVGMGALVGALALTNLNETAAEAVTGTPLKFVGGFSGINLAHKQPIQTVTFGGHDTQGVFTADQVVLTMDTNSYSPMVLTAFAAQTSGMKVVVDGYTRNVQGLEVKFMTITLTGAQIVGYHFASTTEGTTRDTVRLTFDTLDLLSLDTNNHFTWQPVT
jgi:type VI protein secretion system component Hcp